MTTSLATSSCNDSRRRCWSAYRRRGYSCSTSTEMLQSRPEQSERGPMVPAPFEVVSKRQDTVDTWTLELESRGDALTFAPGQFTMLSAGGAGEVPISISGDPSRPERLVHTVRAVGLAAKTICHAAAG